MGEALSLALLSEDVESCAPGASDFECQDRWHEEAHIIKASGGVSLEAYGFEGFWLEAEQ